MAFLEFKNVRVAGFSAGVPKKIICNLDLANLSKDYDAAAFVETTGVLERCAFGVGLSWGTVRFETSDLVISDLVEI